jgi:hypothetical protein
MDANNTMQNLMELPKNQLTGRNDANRLIHNAKVIGECYRVRVLFDTEHLKNDKDYVEIIENTWLRTFKDTDTELLEEAVQNFIVSDKKGYLPKPGQIVELLVKGVKDIERKRYFNNLERLEKQWLFEKYGQLILATKKRRDDMSEIVLNRYVLSQYSQFRAQVLELDENIREIESELAELNQYNINVSPIISKMPNGNEKRDKIAEFIIRLEKDKAKLNTTLIILVSERSAIKYRMHKIRAAVNQVPNKQLREIIKWHYLDEQSINDIAEKNFMTADSIYKRFNRFFQYGSRNRKF